MKTNIGLVFILLTLLFSGAARGDVISVISGDYSVSANYHYIDWSGHIPVDDFRDSNSGNTPLTIYHDYARGGVMSSVSLFSVETRYRPGLSYDGGGYDHDSDGFASASGSWVFKPLVDELCFQVTLDQGYYSNDYNLLWWWLKDLDTGVFVIDIPTSQLNLYPTVYQPVDPTHSYLLRMVSSVSGDTVGRGVSMGVSVTPEPATLLLLGFGVTMLRKRGHSAFSNK